MTVTKCLKCDMHILSSMEAYKQHESAFHTVRPDRTTNRTKEQIVVDTENKMKQFLVGEDVKSHVCKIPCVECLNKDLDRILSLSEDINDQI